MKRTLLNSCQWPFGKKSYSNRELLWLNKFFYWPLTRTHTRIQNIQCWESGVFTPDPNFNHPGSASNNLSILTQKIVSKLSEIWSGLFIPDSDPDFFTQPGSRGKKGTRSRIRNTAYIDGWIFQELLRLARQHEHGREYTTHNQSMHLKTHPVTKIRLVKVL